MGRSLSLHRLKTSAINNSIFLSPQDFSFRILPRVHGRPNEEVHIWGWLGAQKVRCVILSAFSLMLCIRFLTKVCKAYTKWFSVPPAPVKADLLICHVLVCHLHLPITCSLVQFRHHMSCMLSNAARLLASKDYQFARCYVYSAELFPCPAEGTVTLSFYIRNFWNQRLVLWSAKCWQGF